jgi:four helix bundle protein
LGSLFELETQLILSNEFGMLASQDLDELIDKIIKLQKMLTKFLMSLEQK